MNTLNIIKKQIQKASATHDAQIHLTRYRGTDCKVHQTGKNCTVLFAIEVVPTSSDLDSRLTPAFLILLTSKFLRRYRLTSQV